MNLLLSRERERAVVTRGADYAANLTDRRPADFHTSKMRRTEWAVDTGKGDARESAPVSWNLTLWPKRGAAPPSSEAMRSQSQLQLFEETVLPHLDAAFNLARWLMRNDQD